MTRRPLLAAWRAMAGWRWPMLALVLICLGLTPLAMQPQPQWRDWGSSPADTRVQLQTRGHFLPGSQFEVRLSGPQTALAGRQVAVRGAVPEPIAMAVDGGGHGGQSVASSRLLLPRDITGVLIVELSKVGDDPGSAVSWEIGFVLPR